jgi:hypothetical protein
MSPFIDFCSLLFGDYRQTDGIPLEVVFAFHAAVLFIQVIDLHDQKDRPEYDPDKTPELVLVRGYEFPGDPGDQQ